MTMNDKENTIEILESALSRLGKNESVIYFLTYDTKTNARAAIKHIYDMALVLKEHGFNSKILVEEKSYTGVKSWLDESYDILPIVAIKEDKAEIKIDDIIVVPEIYSNILPQLSNIKCIKVMLAQQNEFIFETLPIGSRWSDFGFDKCITTTEKAKKYILEYFPEAIVYKISPYIGDNFSLSQTPIKPYIAISCRDRSHHRKIISEFYLKFPQLRWITFRDMVQMSYIEFSDTLKECMVSLWVDDESTFGTFPLESMKCGVPVVGKIPDTEPEWLSDNGFWTYDGNKIVDILGTYVLAWIEGVELKEEVKEKMKQTTLPYSKQIHNENTLSIFSTLISQRTDIIKNNIEKIKTEVK
jgi:glycosyltransferase involved in cell wall biosynthesis